MNTTLSSQLGLSDIHATSQSQQWFTRAKQVLAGGISSSARSSTTGPLPYPLYIARGAASHVWDVDGHEFVDYLLSYGAALLGHADSGLVTAAQQQLTRGTMFGTCNTVEVELAEQICAMVPGAELVRYGNSGSEVISGAIRAARGFTGRQRILKFEGHYHGWVDLLAISNRPTAEEAGPLEHPHSSPHSRGIPPSITQEVLIAPWNHKKIITDLLDTHGKELAAIILEPIVANNACIMPEEGLLPWLREQCDRRGILLIFDEIVTGFRLARGGAAEYFGVVPDITIFSKAIGGGFPISAFAGRRAVLEPVGANVVKHGGTYNGNPLCASAALYTLRKVNEPGTLEEIHAHGRVCMEAIRRAARDAGIPCVVQGVGSMFQVIFNQDGQPLRHYRDLWNVNTRRYAAFRQALLMAGVHVNSSGSACWFVSSAHTADDMEYTRHAITEAINAVRQV